jgi:S1-C subfamily serine protease
LLERSQVFEAHFPKLRKSAPQAQLAAWVGSNAPALPASNTLIQTASINAATHEATSLHSPDLPGRASNTELSLTSSNSSTDSKPTPRGIVALGIVTKTTEQGPQIVELTPQSAAAKAGLHLNDVIVSVDGTKVKSTEEFEAALVGRPAGSQITFRYLFHTNLGWMLGAEKLVNLADSKQP